MYQERLAIYDNLVAKVPGLERKGKTMPYTSANGYMFSLFNKAGEIGIRLSKAKQAEFIAAHQATSFKSHGATMRDYVKIPDELLDDLDYLAKWLQEGYDYVRTLEPK